MDKINSSKSIYQIFLRPFTAEGTISAAEKLLPHIAEHGFDIVYICPFVEADGDKDKSKWSARQESCGLNNPKSPYRLSDYFKVDREYGTDKDVLSFVKTAHSLGLKVIFDLVYYHCGPKASIIKEDKNCVKCDENGNVIYGEWRFPELNFDSKHLRAHLIENMRYFIKRFNIDGYRCDVGCKVPVDFWRETVREIKKIKPEVFMLNEGEWEKKEYLKDAFDVSYNFEWSYKLRDMFDGLVSARELRNFHEESKIGLPKGKYFLRLIDNHDIHHDYAATYNDDTFENRAGHSAMDAALVVCYTVDGLPFVYNGCEAADNAPHNIFANRDHGAKYRINWSRALTKEGKERSKLIKELNHMRHTQSALWTEETNWLENSEEKSVLSYTRRNINGNLFCVVSASRKSESVIVKTDIDIKSMDKPILCKGAKIAKAEGGLKIKLSPHGYFVARYY